MNSYLLTFAQIVGIGMKLRRFLNTIPQIKNWLVVNQNSLLVTSTADVALISQRIREKFPELNFLLTEIHSETSDGWLAQIAWDHLRKPTNSGAWPDDLESALSLPAHQGGWNDGKLRLVWEKGTIIPNFDPELWRRDILGEAIKYTEFGNRNSAHGWEIDHIKPISKGGTGDIENLHPLHWKTNRERKVE